MANAIGMVLKSGRFVLAMILLSAAIALPADAIEYSYDKLDRLTQVDYDDGTNVTYTYDEAGNILTVPEPDPVALQILALAALFVLIWQKRRLGQKRVKCLHGVLALAIFAATSTSAISAHAAPVEWTLQEFSFQFDDDTYVSGSFVYDAPTRRLLSWDLMVEAGSAFGFPYFALNYNSTEPGHRAYVETNGPDGENFSFHINDPNNNDEFVGKLAIDPISPLPDATGAQVALDAVSYNNLNAETQRETTNPGVYSHLRRKRDDGGVLTSSTSDVCLDNSSCPALDFCEINPGESDGVCTTTPLNCPLNFDPVCGVDDQTYSNACLANMARVNVQFVGECPIATCNINEECLLTEFCQKTLPNTPGVCAARPTSCPQDFDPVCGFDNVTYSNACFAQMARQNVLFPGRCESVDVFAGGCRANPLSFFADPVNLLTGAYTESADLIKPEALLMPVMFSLSYDSFNPDSGAVGNKWRHSYAWRLTDAGDEVVVKMPDGAEDHFLADIEGGTGTLLGYIRKYDDVYSTLEPDGDGTFTYRSWDKVAYEFDENGRLDAILDANGNGLTLAYDGSGRLASITGPAPTSRSMTFTYDVDDRITSVDYESGLQVVTLTYDPSGNLTSFSRPGDPGTTTSYTYDSNSNLLTANGFDGVVYVTNVYDIDGRVVSQTDALLGETLFDYDGADVNVTNPMMQTSTMTFEPSGRLAAVADPSGFQTSLQYDQDKNLERVSTSMTSLVMSYDGNGNLTGQSSDGNQHLGLEYDVDGNVSGITDSNGQRSDLVYDAAGNLTGMMDPIGNSMGLSYDADGRLIGTNYNGDLGTRAYDGNGELQTMTDALGNMGFTYDAMGRADTITDQKSQVTAYQYDVTGAVTSTTDAMNRTATFTNDALGRLMRTDAPGGVTVEYERNAMGDVTAVENAAGSRIEYEYDAMRRIVRKTAPLDRITEREYNVNGKMEKTIDAMLGETSATFDAAGNKTAVTDARGKVTEFQYDSLSRVVGEIDPLGNQTSSGYDSNGSLSNAMNGRGQFISYQYDNALRLVGAFLPDDTITYTLDGAGNRTAITHAAGTTTQTFDTTRNRIQTRTDEFGNTIGYDFDDVGNLTTLTYSDGKQVAYVYDALNRLVQVTDWENRVTTYVYSDAGDIERTDLPDGSSVAYAVNTSKQLTSFTDTAPGGAPIMSAQYTMDAAGRTVQATVQLPLEASPPVESKVFTYNDANQIATVNGEPFVHDEDGNLTSGMIEGQAATLVYDSVNRLTQYRSDAYRYDGEGLRIEATRGGVTVRTVWQPHGRLPKVLEEHDENGQIIARYVHGIGLIGREEAAGSTFSVYHYDKRGSTVALTDIQGNITDRYAYDPYGRVIARVGSTNNPFTFNGRDGVMDDQNGLYFMRARYYVPSLGRFAQAESKFRGSLSQPATMNRYAFALNNPVDRIDPKGEFFNAVGAGIGAIAGATAQIVDNAVQGEPFYKDLGGAVIGGAIAGGLPFGPILGGAIGGGLTNAINQGIDLASGEKGSFDFENLAGDVAIGGFVGGVGGKLFKATPKLVPIPGGGFARVVPPSNPASLWSRGALEKIGQGFGENLYGNQISRVGASTIGGGIFGAVSSAANVLPVGVGWVRYPACVGKGYAAGAVAGAVSSAIVGN